MPMSGVWAWPSRQVSAEKTVAVTAHWGSTRRRGDRSTATSVIRWKSPMPWPNRTCRLPSRPFVRPALRKPCRGSRSSWPPVLCDVGTCRDDPGFQRAFDHVPGQAGVLADDDPAVTTAPAKALGHRAPEGERDLRGHRVLVRDTADAIGAEKSSGLVCLAHAKVAF